MQPVLPDNQRGMALVMVLWIVTLLTVIAASFTLSVRRETVLVRNQVDLIQARSLAEGGINRALLELLNPDTELQWKPDGQLHTVMSTEATLYITVTDEIARIDLNTASDQLLDGLLKSVGVEDSDRPALLDAILDWRDPSEAHRLNGPSEQDYRLAGYDYGPRNGPFQSIGELQRVLGMEPSVFRKMLPSLTLFSGRPGINPAYASRSVLLALPGVNPADIDNYIEQRRLNREQDLPPPLLPGASDQLINQGNANTFRITSFARLPSGVGAGLEAVLTQQRSPNSTVPFTVLDWQEWDRQPEGLVSGEPELVSATGELN